MFIGVIGIGVTACGGSAQPSDESVFSGYPGITAPSNGGVLQCKSQKVEGAGTTPQFRSTYFTVATDGTEVIQSEVVGPTPCP